jgi:hypothetical protein
MDPALINTDKSEHNTTLGDIVRLLLLLLLLLLLSVEYLFWLSDKHNHIDLYIRLYSILLQNSAVHFSYHQVHKKGKSIEVSTPKSNNFMITLHLLFVRRGLSHFTLYIETKSCLMAAEANRPNMWWCRVTTNMQDLYSWVHRTMKIYTTILTNETMTVGFRTFWPRSTKSHLVCHCEMED